MATGKTEVVDVQEQPNGSSLLEMAQALLASAKQNESTAITVKDGSEFWDTYTETLIREDEKLDIAQSNTRFDVVAVGTQESDEYGPSWALSVVVDGQERLMLFSMADKLSGEIYTGRARQFSSMAQYLVNNVGAGIPCRLTKGTTRGGNKWYSVAGWGE